MDDRYTTLTDRLTEAVLTTPGATEPALRQAVAARVAALSAGETPPPGGHSPALDRYLTILAQHAYRTTDADIAAVQADGLTDDAIFELTLAGALGAGQRRLTRGLAALHAAGATPITPATSLSPDHVSPPNHAGRPTPHPEAGPPSPTQPERGTGGEVPSLRLAAVRTGYHLPARLAAAGFADPPDIVKTLLYRPKLFGNAFSLLLDAAMRGPSAWSAGERELFAAFVSRQNQCPF